MDELSVGGFESSDDIEYDDDYDYEEDEDVAPPRSAPAPTSAPAPPTRRTTRSPTTTTTTTPPPPPSTSAPPSASGGGGALAAIPGFAELAANFPGGPEKLQEILNDPQVLDFITNNPDVVQAVLGSNPDPGAIEALLTLAAPPAEGQEQGIFGPELFDSKCPDRFHGKKIINPFFSANDLNVDGFSSADIEYDDDYADYENEEEEEISDDDSDYGEYGDFEEDSDVRQGRGRTDFPNFKPRDSNKPETEASSYGSNNKDGDDIKTTTTVRTVEKPIIRGKYKYRLVVKNRARNYVN